MREAQCSTRQKEDALFTALYQQHAPMLLTHLTIQLPSRMDAEDVLADVFVAALKNLSTLVPFSPEQQRRWLWQVARNKLVDHYRARSYRHTLVLDEVAETLFDDDDQTPEQATLRHEEYGQLIATIKHLPQLQQELLRLHFINGLRSNEIALLIGKSHGAVRVLLSRTLNQLRTLYAEGKE